MRDNLHEDRAKGIDFIRFFSAMGIVIFHFACHSEANWNIFLENANASWGNLLVMTFFMVSGFCLYLNNSKIESVAQSTYFYYKRWKSIFPMFYVGYLFCYIDRMFEVHSLLISPSPWHKIWLTIFGMDGYFLYRSVNFYLIGEWFLGAIVLVYLIYPLILWLFEKKPVLLFSVLAALSCFLPYSVFFEISPFRNLITCTACFVTGMLMARYRQVLQRRILFWASLSILMAGMFFPVPIISKTISVALFMAISFFIVMKKIGEMLENSGKWCGSVMLFGSKISYPVFLVQHVVIMKVLAINNSSDKFCSLGYLLLSLILSIVFAYALSAITCEISNWSLFQVTGEKIKEKFRN
ncbi:MAG: acyltransferase family protein [Bacteroidales bacterium]|nr:acyltransferase family protein [Bacteroidales bacterium]